MKGSILFTFSWRYFKAKKSTQAVNIISWVSMLAMLVGSASLIIILSAFNGFETLVKSLYASFYPDLRISAVSGKTIQLHPDQLHRLKNIQGVYAFSQTIEEKAVLQHDGFQQVVVIKGVDDGYVQTSGLPDKMMRGEFQTGDAAHPTMVLGIGVEQALGIMADRAILPLTVYMPKKNMTSVSAQPMDALSVANALPRGVFSIQSDFDNKYVLTNISFLKTFMNFQEHEISALEIKAVPGANLYFVKEQIKKILGTSYKVEDRFEQNRTLYNTIRLEKLAIYGIFLLMLVIAAFNMVGSLSMLVLEKKRDIQILKAMGASNILVQKIFLLEGVLLSSIGSIGGILLALLICYVQTTYHLVPLEGASFLIDYYPVEWRLEDLVVVGCTVVLIGIAASWVPSRKASAQEISLR